MEFFDSNKKIKNTDSKSNEIGRFVGFVLLSDSVWDKQQFIQDFSTEWGIVLHEENTKDENDQDILLTEFDNMLLTMSLMPAPVPEEEAEHYATANYMWPEAVEIVKTHQAHLLVAVLGIQQDILERGKLFSKAVATCLGYANALAVYTDGAVYQPCFYRDFAMMMKKNELPFMDWVWFGLFNDKNQAGIYTYGMKKFGKDEMEVYVDAKQVNFNELRAFMVDIVGYVLSSNVTLRDGETIGFSEEERLAITRSKGVALDGETLKIEYSTVE